MILLIEIILYIVVLFLLITVFKILNDRLTLCEKCISAMRTSANKMLDQMDDIIRNQKEYIKFIEKKR